MCAGFSNNLVDAVSTRFYQADRMEDLEMFEESYQEALAIRSPLTALYL